LDVGGNGLKFRVVASFRTVSVVKRLYFVLPDNDSCKRVVAELKGAGIPERHLHAVASLAVPLEDVPAAGLTQKTELVHGVERGVALGGAAGLLGGMLVLAFPPAGLVVGGEALLAAVTAGGASVGALALGLISKDIHKKDLAAFENDIAHGRILLMVDVPKEQVEQCKARILGSYPEAAIGVTAPPPT
jgi:hypothetical protein